MPFSKLYSHLNLFLINIVLLMLAGCGSFNSSSLVSSDGIYINESNKENSTSKYYENYFKDKVEPFGVWQKSISRVKHFPMLLYGSSPKVTFFPLQILVEVWTSLVMLLVKQTKNEFSSIPLMLKHGGSPEYL